MLTAIVFIGCRETIIDDSEHEETTPTDSLLNKKGVAYSYKTNAWSHKTSDLAGHWFYHWGNVPRAEIPENIEYVPMFWGRTSVNDDNIARLKQLKNDGKINYVLGFNEPDNPDQSNMTVAEAIALWPRLEEIGVPLVSPGVTGNERGSQWLGEFMQKVDEQGLQVDYIAVHSYGGSNVNSFIAKLRTIHDLYNKPIWITEFAVADWNASTPEENRYSEAEIIEYMKRILPNFDDIEWIHKYAWFDGGPNRPQLNSSRLFDDNNNLTQLGHLYAQHDPNENIGLGTDTEVDLPIDDDELIKNGNFEGGTWEKVAWATWSLPIDWDGYNADVVGSTTTPAHTGNYCARLKNNSSDLHTVINVESGKTYIYKLFSKWKYNNGLEQKTVFKDDIVDSLISFSDVFLSTAEWSETVGEITIPTGVTKLRLVYWNNKATHFYFDDVSFKEKE